MKTRNQRQTLLQDDYLKLSSFSGEKNEAVIIGILTRISIIQKFKIIVFFFCIVLA